MEWPTRREREKEREEKSETSDEHCVELIFFTFKVNLLKKMDGNGTEPFSAEKESSAKYKLDRLVSNKIPAAAGARIMPDAGFFSLSIVSLIRYQSYKQFTSLCLQTCE